jgi:hypothetical protein
MGIIQGNSFLRNRTPPSADRNENLRLCLSAAPGWGALTLSKVAFIVGNLLECLFGFDFLLVEVAVENGRKNTFRIWVMVSTCTPAR